MYVTKILNHQVILQTVPIVSILILLYEGKNTNLIIFNRLYLFAGSTSPVQSDNARSYHSECWSHEKVVWDYPHRIGCADFWGKLYTPVQNLGI